MRGLKLHHFRSFFPVFRFFNVFEGRPITWVRNERGDWFRLDPSFRLSVWNLLINAAGNQIHWENSLLHSFLENPDDSELRNRVIQLLLQRSLSWNPGLVPQGFRVVLEASSGEALVEISVSGLGENYDFDGCFV
jgi:hypothetical protein